MLINRMVTLIILLFVPMCADAFFDNWRAQRAYNNKDYAQSQQFLANQTTTQSQFNLADAQYRAGDLKAASDTFEQLSASKDPDVQQQALFNRGNALAHQKEYKPALEQYDQLLKQELSEAMRERAQHNYDIVKKLLEEQEKKEQEQQKQDQDKDNENKEGQDQQDKDQDQQDQKQNDQNKQQQQKPDDQKKKEQEEKKKEQDKKQQGDKKQDEKKKGDEEQAKEDKKKGQDKQKAPAAAEQDEQDKKMHPQVRALLKQAEEADERGAKQLMKAQVTAMPQKEGQKNW